MSLTGLTLACPSYERVEPMLRTGDVVLYNDSQLQPDNGRAFALSRALALLPCSSYALAAHLSVNSEDESSRDVIDGTNHHLYFFCAALVVCVLDETDTNPQRDPNKLLPYVFTVLDYNQLYFQLVPLRSLIESLRVGGASRLCAVRQLYNASDTGTPDVMRFGSLRRESMRNQVLQLYQQVLDADKADSCRLSVDQMQQRFRAVLSQVQQPRQLPPAPATTSLEDRLALFAASPAYFVLFTLFRVNVLRSEPTVATAVASLQESGSAERLLTSGYQLSDEMPFLI